MTRKSFKAFRAESAQVNPEFTTGTTLITPDPAEMPKAPPPKPKRPKRKG